MNDKCHTEGEGVSMEGEKRIEVDAYRCKGKKYSHLAKVSCPYCGEEHTHGAGLGHRLPHCIPKSEDAKNYGYYIVRII